MIPTIYSLYIHSGGLCLAVVALTPVCSVQPNNKAAGHSVSNEFLITEDEIGRSDPISASRVYFHGRRVVRLAEWPVVSPSLVSTQHFDMC